MGSNILKKGINDLQTVNPAISSEWDTELNGGVTPRDVMAGSEKKVWWRCGLGHSWRAAVYSRNSAGNGCPFCSGQKVLAGFNDLASRNPALASEWDYEKNDPLTPENVTERSNRKVYWKCSRMHTWKDTVNHRGGGRGCPYCAGQRILPGFNDLKTTHPHIAAEWHPEKNGTLTPEEVMAGTEKKVWWLCPRGHSWQAVVYSRKNGCGCPYCAGQKILPGFNDLATIRPDLVLEWDYDRNGDISPDTVAPAASRKFAWICSKGHRWKAGTAERSRGDGCPYCSGKRIMPGKGDLMHAFPELMEEWDWEKNGRTDPAKLAPSSGRKVWWTGKCGHSWPAPPSNRVYGSGCPYCAGRAVLPGFNDLAATHPQIASEWCYERNEGFTPETVLRGSNRYAWFRCRRGHEWRTRISQRTLKGSGCPYCANRLPVAGENDFRTLHPELMKEWDWDRNPGNRPEQYTEGSRKKIHWKCERGHTWTATIYGRTHGGRCPFCMKKENRHKVYPGINDLASCAPGLAAEWDALLNGDLRPEDVRPSSNRGVWWKCEKGHSWRSSPNIRSRGSGCPYCDGKTPRRMRLI